ncbi:hypothetical protein U91I_03557 [alpha proteobacterium U9-1i]|nr:hypothetical protein U91I_03557 [alpha proteobacterium U9-1i]
MLPADLLLTWEGEVLLGEIEAAFAAWLARTEESLFALVDELAGVYELA